MRIAFLGDIALFGCNTVRDGSYVHRFAAIKSVLDTCDCVVGNLETPLTERRKTIGGKSAYIKGSSEDVELLKYLGVTHVTLANNHIFDYRQQGFEDTVRVLDDNHIEWFGVNDKAIRLQSADARVALRGYCCYSTNAKMLRKRAPHVNVLDPGTIECDVEEDRRDGFFSVLCMHWGIEHLQLPGPDHILLARKLAHSGSVLIHGHHPHVIQGIETIDRSLIAYSLGNFCFDDVYTNKSAEPLIRLSQDNQESFVLIVEITETGTGKTEVVPFSFADGTYRIDAAVTAKIDERSDKLDLDMETIEKQRKMELRDYLRGRKKKRDLNWYLKRMNVDSVRMILSAAYNTKRYNKLIRSYIHDTETPGIGEQ